MSKNHDVYIINATSTPFIQETSMLFYPDNALLNRETQRMNAIAGSQLTREEFYLNRIIFRDLDTREDTSNAGAFYYQFKKTSPDKQAGKKNTGIAVHEPIIYQEKLAIETDRVFFAPGETPNLFCATYELYSKTTDDYFTVMIFTLVGKQEHFKKYTASYWLHTLLEDNNGLKNLLDNNRTIFKLDHAILNQETTHALFNTWKNTP